jgi:hypothetical protein
MRFRVIAKITIGACLLATLSACGMTTQKDKPDLTDSGKFAEEYKPRDTDLTGAPGALFGTWAGDCNHTSSTGATSSSCTMTVELQFSGGIVTGQVRLTADGLTNVIDLKSYTLVGNELHNFSDGRTSGSLGSAGIDMYDGSFGEAAGKLVNGEFAFMVRSTPNLRSMSYSLVGLLQRKI